MSETTAKVRVLKPYRVVQEGEPYSDGCPESSVYRHRETSLHAKTASGQYFRAYPPSMQVKKTAIAGAAIVLAGCGGGSTEPAAVTVTSTLEVTKTVAVTYPPPPFAPKTIIETDGTYRVGTDIVPGTYRSGGTSPEGESDCYWARLNSLNPTHIITNNISTGPQVVTIQPSDKAFLTHSCQTWQKD
jgi:hypothetical protein